MRLISDDTHLYSVSLSGELYDSRETDISKQFIKELDSYFKGDLKTFKTKIKYSGTPFQMKVWDALQRIPYGTYKTYKEIAEEIGNKKAFRAVGNACNKNQLLIIVPCHRVIGSNNKLTGFALGLELKKELLEIEGVKI
ncbi:methylated-DNA--[protein]-cysteine S-methyltransferase [Acholeplasma sp. OttesenSCG-928-E16]|nr:methylated-DNA--[protein]-cysteine S-methyltransferase [Acholeplasma sp. OttesenSCG-928-E16]